MHVTYRTRLRQLPWYTLFVSGLNVVLRAAHGSTWPRAFWALVFVAAVVISVRRPRMGVDLTPDALVFRGWRFREFAWREVQSVERAPRRGANRVVVTVRGKEWWLAAPVKSLFRDDPDFEAKADLIRRYWYERRAAVLARIP